jgi:hypothetical protein
MSQFFENYNKINYNMDKNFPVTTTKSVNLFNRVKLREIVKNKLSAYYPYYVKEFERPDTISFDYYGSVNYTWLVLMANDIIDPQYQWPLFGSALNNFIIKKYGSLEESRANIHHYEKIIRPEQIVNTEDGYKKVLEKTVIITKETYDETDNDLRKTISNFEYEIIKNDLKRNIILIDKNYANQIQKEFRTLY